MRTIAPYKRFEDANPPERIQCVEKPLVRVETPIEEDGVVKIAITYAEPEKKPEVPYTSFTAARVYEMGDLTPITLDDCRTSADKLQFVQQVESLIDSNVKPENE